MGEGNSQTRMFLHKSFFVFFFFCLTKLASGTDIEDETDNPCPEHWIHASLVDMGCLLFNSTYYYAWEGANVYCQSKENASLVEITTQDQMDFLRMELSLLEDHEGVHSWWTAATDMGREDDWIWIGSLGPVESFVWHISQPDEGTIHNCMRVGSDNNFEGSDVSCISVNYPICQKYKKHHFLQNYCQSQHACSYV